MSNNNIIIFFFSLEEWGTINHEWYFLQITQYYGSQNWIGKRWYIDTMTHKCLNTFSLYLQ